MPKTMPRGTLLVAPSPMTQDNARRRRKEAREVERIRQRIEGDAREERKFLEYVASNPETSSGKAYRALGIKNDTKGGDIRDTLEDKGFISVEAGMVGGHFAKCLCVTPSGKTFLEESPGEKGALSQKPPT